MRLLHPRWTLEEAGLQYAVESTSFKGRPDEHFNHQPFGQVPWLTDGEVSIFESSADVLYVAETSGKLISTDPKGRNEVIKWLVLGLNSVEMAVLPFTFCKFLGAEAQTSGRQAFDEFLAARLEHVNAYLADREWLAREFSIADIIVAIVLRLADRFDALEE